MLSQSSTNLSYVFESHDNGKEFNDIEEPRKKGIFNKFRERSNRSRSRDKLRDYYSPTSPVSLSELPISISDASSKTIPTLDQRFLPYKESPILQSSLLVTLNNEHFTSLIISENCGTLDALKDEIGQALGIDASDYQIHLTEIGHQPGDVLDDLAMKEVLSHIRVMNYNATVKLYLKQSGISSSHSTNSEISPAHEFGSRKYPSTPSYLINKNNKQIGQQLGQQSDYFNAKYLAPPLTESQKAEILNHGASNDHEVSDKSILTTDGLLTPNNDSSANSVELIVPKESDLNSVEDLQHSKQQTAESPSSTSDSFKVIRPVRREINFDDRRPSPYERRQSNLVALRTAPPPPKRVPSMKKKIMPGASAGSSKDQPVLSVTTMDLPFPPTTNSVNSYSPAASENLIPRPYVGRKNAVIRKPVNSNTGSESSPSPASPNPSNVLSTANLPALASGIHDVEQIKKASENEQSSAAVDKRFQENEVSFDGAPSYDDDSEDSSDDGLWAKKVSPPRTKNALPTLTIPQPDLKIDAAPSLSPTSPYKSPSSAGSPIRASDAWAVRPPEDIVYENLEKFFPNTDLDKPIIDDVTISPGIGIGPLGDVNSLPELSPVVEPRDSPGGTTFKDPWSINPPKTRDESFKEQNRSFHNSVTQGPVSMLRPRMRMKSIRVVAREASEARKKRSSQMVTQPSVGAPNDTLLRRKSTKMWGQRVVEMTASEIRRGHLTSIRDQKGNLQKFAWVKGGLIGKGTFGKVYLALNATTGEMMAVKQVEVPQTASDRSSSRQKEVVSALRTEVETMKDLDHLNIVQYLGFEALEDVYNLFLEYVPGGSVGRILKMHGRFEEVIIKSLTHQVLDGLSYLHSCGILHRVSDFGKRRKSFVVLTFLNYVTN